MFVAIVAALLLLMPLLVMQRISLLKMSSQTLNDVVSWFQILQQESNGLVSALFVTDIKPSLEDLVRFP